VRNENCGALLPADEQHTYRKRHWDTILRQDDDTAKSFRKRAPTQETTEIREEEHADQRTQQKDILFVELDDDAESDGQEQRSMVDKLQLTKKTPYSEPMEGVIQTCSTDEHVSTISNAQNSESSGCGQNRRSQEISTGNMNQPAAGAQGALVVRSKRILTEEEKKNMRERLHRRRSSVLNI